MSDESRELFEPGSSIFPKIYPQRSPPMVAQCLKVTQSLRVFEYAKGVRFVWNRNILSISILQHKKQPVVRTALVELPRRMKIARAIAGGCGAASGITKNRSHLFDTGVVFRRYLDKIQKRDVFSRPGAAEETCKQFESGSRRIYLLGSSVKCKPALLKQCLLLVKRASLLIVLQERFCGVLCLLYIWLIEGIDAKAPSYYGGGKLPQKELLAEIVKISKGQVDHRMAGF
jgi:hypothetical protein